MFPALVASSGADQRPKTFGEIRAMGGSAGGGKYEVGGAGATTSSAPPTFGSMGVAAGRGKYEVDGATASSGLPARAEYEVGGGGGGGRGGGSGGGQSAEGATVHSLYLSLSLAISLSLSLSACLSLCISLSLLLSLSLSGGGPSAEGEAFQSCLERQTRNPNLEFPTFFFFFITLKPRVE